MNLPASAPEFMDAFRGGWDEGFWQGRAMPVVHLYAFSKDADAMLDVSALRVWGLGVRVSVGASYLLVYLGLNDCFHAKR